MATTLQTFVTLKAAALIGAVLKPAGSVVAYDKTSATTIVNGGAAAYVDRQSLDLANGTYALNGAFSLALVANTPATVDFTAIAGSSTSAAGDGLFNTVYQLVFANNGTADVVVSVGASNPFRLPLGGTTPTLTVPAGSVVALGSIAGFVVDSTHKTILFTPPSNAAASIAVAIGGA